MIPAGEIARYPKALAEHALKHLVDKILTKKGVKTNHEVARGEVMNQVVIGSESIRGERTLTETEKLRAKVEELNKTSTLDSILERRKLEKDESNKPTEEVATTETPADNVERFDGLEKLEDKPEDKPVATNLNETLYEIKKEEETKVIPMPTRQELLDYAVAQNLVLDEPNKEGKTLRETYIKMKVEDLVRELNYPLEENK